MIPEVIVLNERSHSQDKYCTCSLLWGYEVSKIAKLREVGGRVVVARAGVREEESGPMGIKCLWWGRLSCQDLLCVTVPLVNTLYPALSLHRAHAPRRAQPRFWRSWMWLVSWLWSRYHKYTQTFRLKMQTLSVSGFLNISYSSIKLKNAITLRNTMWVSTGVCVCARCVSGASAGKTRVQDTGHFV